MTFSINGRKIGMGFSPFLIAEMSGNHNGDINNAFLIIDEAKKAGADAIKIQTYTPDTMTLNCDSEDFQIHGGLWDGWSLYKLYEWAQTPLTWHKALFDYAAKINITLFSTPFDKSAVDLLEDLNVPAYKIASFEAIDLQLISYVASTGKPIIISTGMANEIEIMEAVDTAKSAGARDIALLHCVSGYPAPASDYNLHTITDMIKRYGLVTGLSDHTIDNATAICSVGLGASIIEKHFTLDQQGGGPDDSFSLEPKQFSELCYSVRLAWESLGKANYKKKSSEEKNVKFRRSLYFTKDMKAGDIITHDCVRSVRPGYGLPPKFIENVLGRSVSSDIQKNTPVKRHLVDWPNEKMG